MSKHCHDGRLFEAYITELFAPVMRVMAGFKQTATYHVPCTEVEPDCDAAECTRRVFPMWETWKEQQRSPHGDKHKSAVNFLYHVLPFCARVIYQDEPYWLKHYPLHEYSRFLHSKMPPSYPVWARTAIQKAKDLADAGNLVNIEGMSECSFLFRLC